MEVVCLSEQSFEALGFLIRELLKPEVRALQFNNCLTERDIMGLFTLPTTKVYCFYNESRETPMGAIFFFGVSPNENCSVHMVFFSEVARSQGLSSSMCDFIKKDLLSKCPTINSIETSIVEGEQSDIEETIKKIGFEKIGTRRRYKRVGEKYLDISDYYYLCERD